MSGNGEAYAPVTRRATVERGISGGVTHLGVDETYLWPGARCRASRWRPPPTRGVVAIYAHRSDVPQTAWREFFKTAEREIGVLTYAGLFLADPMTSAGATAPGRIEHSAQLSNFSLLSSRRRILAGGS